jgi:hypothetical protein
MFFDNSSKYFEARQNCKQTPYLPARGDIQQLYIYHSYFLSFLFDKTRMGSFNFWLGNAK